MASPACPSLSRISPDLPHPHHPHLPHRHSLFPLPPPDPLPSFSLTSSPSLSSSPLVRHVFDDSVCAARQELDVCAPESSLSSCFLSSDDDDDDDNDTGTSTSTSTSSSSCSLSQVASPPEGPLDNLTSLCAALPIKRGLSRYFSGKSQSFSSLAWVSSVAELAKPENPYAKRQRTGTGADLLTKHHSYPPKCDSSAGSLKRPATSNRRKSLKSVTQPVDVLLDGHANPRPSKCFSAPEF